MGREVFIAFVNHASVILEASGKKLITDPWLEGLAFDSSWSLLAKSTYKPDDFANVKFLWLSHEHPDHFHIPTLKSIRPDIRKNISVFYQKTVDKKLARTFSDWGFQSFQEMSPEAFYPLGEDFEILCQPFTDGDSWLLAKCGSTRVLNLNDCQITDPAQARQIKKKVGEIDVLLAQFSYASWHGNEENVARRKQAAHSMLRNLISTINILKPKAVVPFASFVRFCHVENNYMNDGVNHIRDVYQKITELTTAECVVMYPGDRWQVGRPHDSQSALERYDGDYEVHSRKPVLQASHVVTFPELAAKTEKFLKRYHPKVVSWYPPGLSPRPVRIKISDLDIHARLSLEQGLQLLGDNQGVADISLSSEVLAFCLDFPWGWGTMNINGRFQVPPGGDPSKFRSYFYLPARQNRGLTRPGLFQYLCGEGLNRFKTCQKVLTAKFLTSCF